MNDPFEKAVAVAPATLGQGCLSRYDIDELSAEDGADFSQAKELLGELHAQAGQPANPAPEKSR
ncbi:hypothetical protein [Pseudomonas marincola]|uniref:hypothetical protein n=1 Tax=Pseudomonas marincola TaxID=437900 RepID=UPI0008E6720E|nr:hypothetical protein [Pseudomonas marincola]SFU15841.1 hypothetical protein SAMN05216264_11611 [Pseudomonas marincola]